MNAAATVDPVRAQVEEALRHAVEAATTLPCDLVRRARDAAGRTAERVGETVGTSFALARTVGELAVGSLLGIGRSAVAPAADGAPSGPPTLVAVPGIAEPPMRTSTSEPAGSVDSTADHLPLDDYESLAASHVVARLARLSPAELAQIREFEQAHRGRRTILGKIEQLLDT